MMDGLGSRGERYMKIASSDNNFFQKNSCNSIPKWSRGGIWQCPKCTPNRTEHIQMGAEIQPKCARGVPGELVKIMLRKKRSGAAKCRAEYPI